MNAQSDTTASQHEVTNVVIGAGVSGLVAAARLAAAGETVRVLEAAPRLGGCVQTWQPTADFWLELGAHTAYNSYGALLEALAARARLDELLPRAQLGYRLCLPDGRLQSPLRRLSVLEAAVSLPVAMLRGKGERSVAEWFGMLLGRGNYRRLLAPAFAAVLSQPADAFPARWLFRRKPRIQSAPRKFTFAGGLQGLLAAVAEGAPFAVTTGAAATGITRLPHGFAVHVGGQGGSDALSEPGAQLSACEEIVASGPSARRPERSDETYQVDRRGASTAQHRNRDAQQIHSQALTCRRVVLAVPVQVAAQLLTEVQPEVAGLLAGFPRARSEAMGVVLPADASPLPRVAGLIGVDGDFYSVVTRDVVPHARYRGFTFHFRPQRLDRAAKLACIARVLRVAPEAFLHVAEAVNHLPAPTLEHPRRVAEVDRLLAREAIALTGNYLNGLSLGDCAERAAREVERLLTTGRAQAPPFHGGVSETKRGVGAAGPAQTRGEEARPSRAG